MDSHVFPYIPYPDVTMGCNEVTEEKAYGSDNEYDGGESDEEAQEFLGDNCWVLASMNGDLMGISNGLFISIHGNRMEHGARHGNIMEYQRWPSWLAGKSLFSETSM
jgi:hypothetical protein